MHGVAPSAPATANYWDIAYSNVEAVYEHGLLSEEQWEFVEAVYDDIERENGQVYDLPEAYEVHMAGKAADSAAVTEQVVELELPGRYGWEYEE